MDEKYKIEIIEFSDQLSSHIKVLNYEWLEKHFRVEDGDVLSLSDPKKHIIDKGGYIYYAKLNDKIVGTASLLRKSEKVYELGKMAVAEKAQGFGIGTILLKHCIEVAKQKQIEILILYSNTFLESAIHLYRKFGFEEVKLESGLYERANIKMQKQLY
ncbi:MAG: GNAT family N-acetyltransferase [Leadbetterella sp.]